MTEKTAEFLSSVRFKSITKDLIKHGLSFNDTHLVAKDLLKQNNTRKICLIRQNIILCYF